MKNVFREKEDLVCSEGGAPSPYHVIAGPSVDVLSFGHLVSCVHGKGEE